MNETTLPNREVRSDSDPLLTLNVGHAAGYIDSSGIFGPAELKDYKALPVKDRAAWLNDRSGGRFSATNAVNEKGDVISVMLNFSEPQLAATFKKAFSSVEGNGISLEVTSLMDQACQEFGTRLGEGQSHLNSFFKMAQVREGEAREKGQIRLFQFEGDLTNGIDLLQKIQKILRSLRMSFEEARPSMVINSDVPNLQDTSDMPDVPHKLDKWLNYFTIRLSGHMANPLYAANSFYTQVNQLVSEPPKWDPNEMFIKEDKPRSFKDDDLAGFIERMPASSEVVEAKIDDLAKILPEYKVALDAAAQEMQVITSMI